MTTDARLEKDPQHVHELERNGRFMACNGLNCRYYEEIPSAEEA